jgi:hypothetical protein
MKVSADACRKYAEVCRLRHSRLMDIEEAALFRSLEIICLQAAKVDEYAGLRELQRESEALGLYDGGAP